MNKWYLRVTDSSAACQFAAEEFCRLMKRMDPDCVAEISAEAACLSIGVDSTMDPEEDRIAISVRNCGGRIVGSNPRSVLVAVYQFFTECGCGFVRPDRDGEYVPQKNSAELCVELSECAAYRHRGICIEGTVSYENIVQIVDWAPKVGMNTYFTQFFTPYTFFDRWYSHVYNPWRLPTPVSRETVDRFVKDYQRELDKRGLLHHGVGHGWTAEALGLSGLGWQREADDSVPADKEHLVALIGGKRRLWNRVVLNTNLCYSSAEVQQLLVEKVKSYATAHPEMAYIHFWLADDGNNHCECECCQTATPSDFYVDILNALDEALTEAGLSTKIVFLLYNELWWPPVKARIRNPERFTMMFAPIARTYSEAMHADAEGTLVPYERNKIRAPRSVGDALESLRAWQKIFSGDSFVFDYHYMWDHVKDPGYYRMAQVLREDVENLHSLGLDGYISCQVQRTFMPNGLGMYLMGRTLWKGKTDFETESADFFRKTYGEDSELCRRYLQKLSDLFDPPMLRGEKPAESLAENARGILREIDAFAPVIGRNLLLEEFCHQRSWDILQFHAGLCRYLAEVLLGIAEGQLDEAKSQWSKLRRFARVNEMKYQAVFDMPLFLSVWESQVLPVLCQTDWSE